MDTTTLLPHFEWDEEKSRQNLKKHRISFDAASKVFLDPDRIELYDELHSFDEERYITIGIVHDVVFVVYTMRAEIIRIISARMATSYERSLYYEQR